MNYIKELLILCFLLFIIEATTKAEDGHDHHGHDHGHSHGHTEKKETNNTPGDITCTNIKICQLTKLLYTESGKKSPTLELIGSTTDPHHFSPSTNDLKKLHDSKILLIGPKQLDTWATRVIDVKDNSKKIHQVSILDSLFKTYKTTNAHSLAHFWLYPEAYCRIKAELLLKLNTWGQNLGDKFECDISILKTLENVVDDKVVITTHDALIPLLERFDANAVNVFNSDHDDQLTSKKLKEIINITKSNKERQIIWIQENQMKFPEALKKYMKRSDKLININLLQKETKEDFSELNELIDKMKG